MQINPDIFEARLKEAIKPEPLKIWCERVGVNLATLNSAFQRKAVPKVELLVQVASVTGRSIDWLIGFSDEDRRFQATQPTGHNASEGHDQNWAEFVQVPLYRVKASAGHGAQIDREDVDQYLAFRRDFLFDRLHIPGNGLYCVKVTGVSMEPILRDGNPVLIEPTGGEVLTEGPHLLRLEGALLLKNLQRLPGGRLRIWSENHTSNAYQPIEVDWPPREGVDLQVFGRVRWSDNVF